MSTKVENTIQLRSPKWQTRLPHVESVCDLAANATWTEAFDGTGTFEMTIVLADDVFIQELNLKYRTTHFILTQKTHYTDRQMQTSVLLYWLLPMWYQKKTARL